MPALLRGREGRRFVFTAGSIRPARGLCDALAALATGPARDLDLVVAGVATADARRHLVRLENMAVELGVADRVVWAGQLDEAEMSWCFSRCQAFLMTSRAEACPNTALEALTHGTLIVSTDRDPMPEFLERIAWYYEPGDHLMLGNLVAAAIGIGEDERSQRREAARRRARDFRWTETARLTVGELAQARRAQPVLAG
jgi:glycosyltransferase involved in cell wall biosynthesis